MRRARHSISMSQVELARRVGLSLRHLIRIECGDRAPRLTTAEKIAFFLLTTPYALFGDALATGAHLARSRSIKNVPPDDGLFPWSLTVILRGGQELHFGVRERDRERTSLGIGLAMCEQQVAPFIQIEAGENVFMLNLDHVPLVELMSARPDAQPDYVKASACGCVLIVGDDEAVALARPDCVATPLSERRLSNARKLLLETSRMWTRGSRATFEFEGGGFQSFLVNDAMLMDVPLWMFARP
ncbi:helix-turn-helix transcriptional regulator [Paraburkholderia sediminicola]|uniref:helix-turn-helix transcriptional regulator n=1 Tax=Paraburkholderia sediminicola TaxID=458836 RepID=UPI0038BA8E26